MNYCKDTKKTAKLLLHIVISLSILLLLVSCKKAPIQTSSMLKQTDVSTVSQETKEKDNLHLLDMPEKYVETLTQGKLSLPIDAVIKPMSKIEIYSWNSDFFDFSDTAFQEGLADLLLGEGYQTTHDKTGTSYETDSGHLSFEPEKDIFGYSSKQSGEMDQTNENFISTENLDHENVLKVNELVKSLNLSRFTVVSCEKFGNNGATPFYYMYLEPQMEGLPIQNSNVQPNSDMNMPPYEQLQVAVGEDGSLWSLFGRFAKIDESSKHEVLVVPVEDAIAVIKKEGLPLLSGELSAGKSLTVRKVQLVYAHFPFGDAYQLTPVWMFSIENIFQLEDETVQRELLFAVNAITGEVV